MAFYSFSATQKAFLPRSSSPLLYGGFPLPRHLIAILFPSIGPHLTHSRILSVRDQLPLRTSNASATVHTSIQHHTHSPGTEVLHPNAIPILHSSACSFYQLATQSLSAPRVRGPTQLAHRFSRYVNNVYLESLRASAMHRHLHASKQSVCGVLQLSRHAIGALLVCAGLTQPTHGSRLCVNNVYIEYSEASVISRHTRHYGQSSGT